MAFKTVPYGWETSDTVGTGALTLNGALTNYPNTGDVWRALSEDLANNDTTYVIVRNRSQPATEWGEYIATWGTGGILTLTTIVRTGNGDLAVDFTAGIKDVMCTPITAAAVPVLTANAVVLGGGAGVAPFTDAGLTFNPTTDVLSVGAATLSGADGTTSAVAFGRSTAVNTGMYFPGSNQVGLVANGVIVFTAGSGTPNLPLGVYIGDASNTAVYKAAANSLRFGTTLTTTGNATSRTEINKAVTAFTDGVAKATFTVTIPNAAHCATLEVEVTGICGAGGAIGAGEATATNSYKFNIVRTAGVNAVVAASAAFGAAAANVAGATTLTATAAASAISGAVGAVNTFTVDVTITKGGGASDNHTCLMYGKLMNNAASGITIA